MISNISYQLSCFADYSFMEYNKEDVVKLLEGFKFIELVPHLVKEINPNGSVSQRMHFTAEDKLGQYQIFLNSERIDISITSIIKTGFTESDIPKISSILEKILSNIYSIYGKKFSLPYRLAWTTDYVYIDNTDEEKSAYKNKFLREIRFFKKNPSKDMIARFATQRKVVINKRPENLNVLATINYVVFESSHELKFEGYKINYDINSSQWDRNNRFDLMSVSGFIKIAIKLQKEINKDILP